MDATTVGACGADDTDMPRRALSRLLPALAAALLLALTFLAPSPASADPGVITGSTSDFDDNALPGVTVDFIAAGGADNPALATATTGADGSFSVAAPPAGAYWVRFSKSGFATTFLDNGEDEGPVTLTVGADGALSAPGLTFEGDDRDLGIVTLRRPAPVMSSAPAVSGKLAVGQVVTLSPGAWSIATDPEFLTVEWFLNGKNADEFSDGNWFQKFEVPLSAVGKSLSYVLTVDDPTGERDSATYSGTVGSVPKATSSVAGTAAKGKLLNVQVTVPGVPNPKGQVVVKEKKKTLGTVTLKPKGKGKLKLKLKPGKHKLTLTYAGNAQTAPSTGTVKVTVPK